MGHQSRRKNCLPNRKTGRLGEGSEKYLSGDSGVRHFLHPGRNSSRRFTLAVNRRRSHNCQGQDRQTRKILGLRRLRMTFRIQRARPGQNPQKRRKLSRYLRCAADTLRDGLSRRAAIRPLKKMGSSHGLIRTPLLVLEKARSISLPVASDSALRKLGGTQPTGLPSPPLCQAFRD
jgi:hypothetical protein